MIKLINNKDFIPLFKDCLNKCDSVTILTAFLSFEAVEYLFSSFTKKIDLFTSFHNEPVAPRGLQLLLDIKATVYIYTGISFFHPKVYLFNSDDPVAIIGSSNLTRGGIGKNIEINLFTDDSVVINDLVRFISTLKNDPRWGILNEDSLKRYFKLFQQRQVFMDQYPIQNIDEHSNLLQSLDFTRFQIPTNDNIHKILKIKVYYSGETTRKIYKVFWLAEKNVIYGTVRDFFPQQHIKFELTFHFGGRLYSSFNTHITKSNQISGLYYKLDVLGFLIKPGDILCFEELEEKRIYRLWKE